MKFYLCQSSIKHDDCDYLENYLIKVEGELPDDAERQLTQWNWGGDWVESEYGVLDLGRRTVSDYILGEVSATTVGDISQWIYVCTPKFNYEEKGNE